MLFRSRRPPPAAGLSKMEGAPRAPLALRLLIVAALPVTGWLTTGTFEPPLLPRAPKVGHGGRGSAGILGRSRDRGRGTAASPSTPPTSGGQAVGWGPGPQSGSGEKQPRKWRRQGMGEARDQKRLFRVRFSAAQRNRLLRQPRQLQS